MSSKCAIVRAGREIGAVPPASALQPTSAPEGQAAALFLDRHGCLRPNSGIAGNLGDKSKAIAFPFTIGGA